MGGPAPRPIGDVKILTRDLLGNVKEEKDHAGLVTRYEHDGLYRVRKRHLPEAPYFEEYGYDLVGNRTSVKDPNGHETRQSYDGLNRVVETINALGHKATVTYADLEGSKVNKAEERDVTRGLRTAFTYDRANREKTRTVHLEGAGGAGQAYETKTDYDDERHAYTVTDPEGGQTTYTLDGLDRVAEKAVLVDGDRLETRTTYDGLGNVKSVVDARGHLTQHFYDALGRRTLTVDVKGKMARASYDGGGLKLTERDRRGIERTLGYDNLGRLTRTSLPGSISLVGWSQETEYLDVQRKRIERDARRHATTYELDGLDRPTKVFDGVHSRPLVITYDGVNKRTETDRRGNTTSFAYDKLNRLTTTTDPEPFETQTQVTTYEDGQNRRTVKDRRNIPTVTQLDPLGRVLTVTRAGVVMETNDYDGNGNKVLALDGERKQTKFTYDAANHLRVRIDGFGSSPSSVTSFTYDKAGNLETERDARAAALNLPFSSKKTYDSLNRLETETNGKNETTVYGYDEEGNRTSVQEPKGQTTKFAYDELGKLRRVTQPEVAGVRPVTSYVYDANRNRILQTDAGGSVVKMEYDDLNRLRFFRQDPDGFNLVTERVYDENGNETTLIDPKKQTVTSTYDELNRLKTKSYAFAATDPLRPWRHTTGVVYTYHPSNNVKTVVESVAGGGGGPPPPSPTLLTVRDYDDFDRLLSEKTALPDTGGDKTVGYSYFKNGTRKTVTLDGVATTYEYDGQNRLKTATPDGSGATVYGYFGDGLVHTIAYPNGVVATHVYDNADRLTDLTSANGTTVVSRYQYGYDTNGNRLSQTETLGGVTEQTTYTYDLLNRLETVTYPVDASFPNGRLVTYGYDRTGNRETETTKHPTTLATLSTKNGGFDKINRLTSLAEVPDVAVPGHTKTTDYTYDKNGNQTAKTVTTVTPVEGGPPQTTTVVTDFFYDIRDKMVQAKQGTLVDNQYQHDAFGRLIHSFDDHGVKQYVYDGTSRLAEFYLNGAQAAKYDYGDRLIRLTHITEGQRYYSFDALGSVTALTDPFGATTAAYHLDAWGIYRKPEQIDDSKNRFGFTGYEYSPLLGLYYANARFYDPEVGRFTSQDSYLGKIDDPPSLHRFTYANDRPTYFVDPTGHGVCMSTADPGCSPVRNKGRDPATIDPARRGVEDDNAAYEYTRKEEQEKAARAQAAQLAGAASDEAGETGEPVTVQEEHTFTGPGADALRAVGRGLNRIPIIRKTGEAVGHALDQREAFNKKTGVAARGVYRSVAPQQDEVDIANRANRYHALEGEGNERLREVKPNIGQKAMDTGADVVQVGAENAMRYGGDPIAAKVITSAVAAAAVTVMTTERTYIVYTIRNAEGQVLYVGRASGRGTPAEVLAKRITNHHHRGAGTFRIEEAQASRSASRGAEDIIYNRERLRAQQEGRTLLNKDNPVSPRNPRRRGYVDAYNKEMTGD